MSPKWGTWYHGHDTEADTEVPKIEYAISKDPAVKWQSYNPKSIHTKPTLLKTLIKKPAWSHLMLLAVNSNLSDMNINTPTCLSCVCVCVCPIAV